MTRALHWRIAPALGLILCLAVVWSLALSLALVRPHAALAAPIAGPALREAQAEPMRTVLVRPKADPGRMAMRSARAAGLRERHMARRFARLGIEQWSVPQGQDPKAFAAELMATGEFEYAEPNVRRYRRDRIPNDPGYASQWAMHGAAGSMNMEAVWDLTTGSRDVVVAVIDDSVAINHPDLAANIVAGWDFVGNDANPSPGTGDYHGTNVAGCVGAVGDNGLGVSGAAWQVSIMPLRFDFSTADEIAAFDYALAHGAHIINASWGGPDYSQAEADALNDLEQAGILLVVAAGNWNMDNDLVVDYPSGLPNKNIVSVAASNQANGMVPWSHFGATSVDLAAPGVSIYTTANNSYTTTEGTSFSSPYVAGIAALIKSKALADGVDGPDGGDADYHLEIKGRLLAGASAMDDAKGRTATGGRVDAYKALTVEPQPVPMIAGIVVDDTGQGNGNGELDPGETAKLQVTLENYWLDAQSLTGVLSCANAKVSVDQDTDSLPGSLASGATAVEPLEFTVWLSDEAEAPATLLFDLELSGTDANSHPWSATRSFPLRLSTLPMGTTIQEASLDRSKGQAFELFHVDVPEGAETLSVTVAANEDVDLLIRKDGPPQFDLECFYTFFSDCFWDDTESRTSTRMVEAYAIPEPEAGTYYFAVLSARDPYDDSSPLEYGLGEGPLPSQFPIADAGPDQTVAEGSLMYLDGSNSSDPDSDRIITWAWKQTSGPAVALHGSGTKNPSFTAPRIDSDSEEIHFTLEVTDATGAKSARDSVVVTVTNTSASGSGGCSLRPGAGLGWEWLLLAGLAIWLRPRVRRG